MKRILLYFFLFIYSLVVFKPYVPYLTDAVAHILFFKDHTETVHLHHGKSHVHAEVNQLVKNEQSEKTTNNSKKDTTESDHLVIVNYQYLPRQISINWPVPISASPTNTFTKINLPPPKV